MGQEILYTSAPQGLRAGASGFCTVSSTAGMEPNLAEFLEGFSGYAHPFKPPDPRTKENPVNFSHIQWTIGGQKYQILSRVADAGLDYTGRTNLLAHHVALPRREAERCPGGPAWVLAQDGFAITKWNPDIKTLPGQKPTTTEKPLQKCTAWEAAAGDAGYAGVLAESVKDKGGRPVIIIYPSYCDTLALLTEAISLLPPEKRWSVTFATLYSRIYSSFDCQWRFVFHESAEARAAKRDANALVLDLTKGKLPPARGGELVTLAREGVRAQAAASAPVVRSSPGAVAPAPARGRPGVPQAQEGDLKLLPPTPPPSGDGVSLPPADPEFNPFAKAKARRMSNMVPVIGAFLGGISLTLAFFIFMVLNQKPAPVVATNTNNNQANQEITPPKEITRPKPQPIEAPEPERRPGNIQVVPDDLPASPAAVNVTPEETPESTNLVARTPTNSITSKGPERPVITNDPFEDIVKRKQLLALPSKGGSGLKTGPVSAATNQLLAMVFVATGQEVELSLVGAEPAFGKTIAPLISFQPIDKEDVRTWPVVKKPTGTAGTPETIGTFKLEKQKLTFEWGKAQGSSRPDSLRFCLLEVKVNGETQLCRLTPPIMGEGIKLDKMPRVSYELPKADSTALPDPANLLLELQGHDLGGELEQRPTIPINVGQDKSIYVRGGNGNKGPVLQLIVSFAFDKDKERERTLTVTGKATYHLGDVTEEESLNARGGPIDVRLMTDRKKGQTDKVNSFDLQLRRAESKLTAGKREMEPEIKRLRKELGDIEKRLKDLKDAKGPEKELFNIKKRSNEADIKQLEAEIEDLENAVKNLTKSREEAKEFVGLQQEVLDLMDNAMKKGRIEYRIFVQENGNAIEIYRSKGFE